MTTTPPSVAAPASPEPGPWHDWTGGECPVAGEVWVDVKWRDGKRDKRRAFHLEWDQAGHSSDIIAYRYSAVTPVAVSDAALDAKGIRDAALEDAAQCLETCDCDACVECAMSVRALKSGGVDGEPKNG